MISRAPASKSRSKTLSPLIDSELSDDDMPSDDDAVMSTGEAASDGEDVVSAAEKTERMRKLVPSLPAEDWGRKPVPAASDDAPSMRPPIFAKQSFDGVVSDSDEEDEDDVLPPPGTIGRKIAEMKWGDGDPDKGAKIEAIDEDAKFGLDADIDEQMHQRVWGEEEKAQDVEMDPDMGEEEDEFLKFSREALGITDDMWEAILSSRRERGGEWMLHSRC